MARFISHVICLAAILWGRQLLAEGPEAHCDGELLKPKKDNIAVYADPRPDAEIIARLTLGGRVCGVGEQSGFAIIAWKREELPVEPGKQSAEAEAAKTPQLAFVRLVDVWRSPRTQNWKKVPEKKEDLMATVQRWLRYAQSGIVPEDGLLPYRPLMDAFERKKREEEGQ